jgi:hypothetical protein
VATAFCFFSCLAGVRITLIMSWHRRRGGRGTKDGET